MKCDIKKTFKLKIGEANPLVYLKNHYQNFNEKPIINNKRAQMLPYASDLHLLLTPNGGI